MRTIAILSELAQICVPGRSYAPCGPGAWDVMGATGSGNMLFTRLRAPGRAMNLSSSVVFSRHGRDC